MDHILVPSLINDGISLSYLYLFFLKKNRIAKLSPQAKGHSKEITELPYQCMLYLVQLRPIRRGSETSHQQRRVASVAAAGNLSALKETF